MADEKKDTLQILMPNLDIGKKTLLLQTSMTPGFQVIIDMANEAALRATKDISKLDPEGPDYERKVVERGRRARNISEWFDLLFKSVFGHTDSLRKREAQEDRDAQDAVDKTLGIANSGIHLANPKEGVDAVTKTFGIYPARPRKVAKK